MTFDDVRVVVGNPSLADMHETLDRKIITWNYCLRDSITAVDFSDGKVFDLDSRSGDHDIYNCKDASREMWVIRRGRDAGK